MIEAAYEVLRFTRFVTAFGVCLTTLTLLVLLVLYRESIASALSRLRRVGFAMRFGGAEISGNGVFDPNPSLDRYRKPSQSRTIEQIVEHREEGMRGSADSP